MKKILAGLLAVLMLFSFVACQGNGTGNTQTTDGTVTTATTTSSGTTEGTTTGVFVDEPVQITMEELKNYVIIRPGDADLTMMEIATALATSLNNKDLGTTFKVKSDMGFDAPTEYEILLGETNRPETEQFKRQLRNKDFGFGIINKKIVIYGYGESNLRTAVSRFNYALSTRDFEDGIFLAAEDTEIRTGRYDYENATIAGHSLTECVLVYPDAAPNGEDSLAEKLSATLLIETSYFIPTKSDAEPRTEGEYEILIGATNRTGTLPAAEAGHAIISATEESMIVTGVDSIGMYYAIKCLPELFADDGNGTLALVTEEPFIENSVGDGLRIMSYNIKVGDYSVERADKVIAMIKSYVPDVVGIQEANPTWMAKLKKDMPEYEFVGVGREGVDQGEHSCIAYRKDLFNLIETKTRWLSDTPTSVSKYEESAYIRIVTWAVLERKTDGKTFMHLNTHLDWSALSKQVTKLLELVDGYDYPMFVTGDFNMSTTASAFNLFLDAGFVNSSRVADKIVSQLSYSAGSYPLTTPDGNEIDFCLIKAEGTTVSEYRVCNEDFNGKYASDHHPIYIEFNFD